MTSDGKKLGEAATHSPTLAQLADLALDAVSVNASISTREDSGSPTGMEIARSNVYGRSATRTMQYSRSPTVVLENPTKMPTVVQNKAGPHSLDASPMTSTVVLAEGRASRLANDARLRKNTREKTTPTTIVRSSTVDADPPIVLPSEVVAITKEFTKSTPDSMEALAGILTNYKEHFDHFERDVIKYSSLEGRVDSLQQEIVDIGDEVTSRLTRLALLEEAKSGHLAELEELQRTKAQHREQASQAARRVSDCGPVFADVVQILGTPKCKRSCEEFRQGVALQSGHDEGGQTSGGHHTDGVSGVANQHKTMTINGAEQSSEPRESRELSEMYN